MSDAPPDVKEPPRLERHQSEEVRVLAAVTTLREGTDDETILGDGDPLSRNLAVAEAANTLSELLDDDMSLSKLAVEAGAIEAAVTALRLRPNSEAVQKKATLTLGLLASLGRGEQDLAGEVGGVQAAISALTGHPNSIAVQQPAIQALRFLVADNRGKNQRLAGEKGGIQAALVALFRHAHIEDFQSEGLAALAHMLAGNAPNQLEATQAGGIASVMMALKKHPRNLAVQEYGIKALGHLGSHSDKNQAAAEDAGAVKLVLDVRMRYQNSRAMQVAALSALGQLVSDNLTLQTQLMKKKGLEVVVDVMSQYSTDLYVQEHACVSLGSMTSLNVKTQTQAHKLGLIDIVIKLARANIRHANVQIAASQALTGLVVCNMSNQKHAGRNGAIDVVNIALGVHCDDRVVLTSLLQVLGQLCSNCHQNKILARDLGALSRVIAVLWQDPSDPAVDETKGVALLTLRNLILDSHENTKVVVAMGGIEEAVEALQTGFSIKPTRSAGGEAQVIGRPELKRYQKLARESGLLQSTVSALDQPRAKPQATGITRMAGPAPLSSIMSILSDLVSEDLSNQLLAGELGGVCKLISELKVHEQNEVAQAYGIGALNNLISCCAANQRLAKEAGAEKVLRNSRALHPGSISVSEQVSRCLEVLRCGKRFREDMLLTNFGQRHQACISIPETAMRGITLNQLSELDQFMQDSLTKCDIEDSDPDSPTYGESILWEKMNMYQVKHTFILPLTKSNKCSYVEAIAEGQQPPMWMVSHWWGTTFAFTVRMLQLQASMRDCRSPGSVTYWCCTMANNQHNITSELEDEDLLKSPFARAMMSQRCMGTVLLVDPEVTPLTRIWCVFEARVTQQLRRGMLADRTEKQKFFLDIVAPVVQEDSDSVDMRKVSMTMLQDAIGESWHEVSDTHGVKFPLRVAEIGVTVDVRHARASHEEDRLTILNYVSHGIAAKSPPPEAHPKYDELNNFVHTVFASAELYRLACEQPEGCVEKVAELLKLGADVNSFVREGNTALLAAAGADSTSRPGSARPRVQHELVELLLEHGADVNHVNSQKETVHERSWALPEETRALLVEHEAKTFEEVIPQLERRLNAKMTQLLATGFSSEWQAYEGGGAGTKLRAPAQRSLQALASAVLKPYPWSVCTIEVQASTRHQQKLANSRAESVLFALESAGCENSFNVNYGAQSTLLRLSVSLQDRTGGGSGRQLSESESSFHRHSEDREASVGSSDAFSSPVEGKSVRLASGSFSSNASLGRDDSDFTSPKVLGSRFSPSTQWGAVRRKPPVHGFSLASLANQDVREVDAGGIGASDSALRRSSTMHATREPFSGNSTVGSLQRRESRDKAFSIPPILTKTASAPVLLDRRARDNSEMTPTLTPSIITSGSRGRNSGKNPSPEPGPSRMEIRLPKRLNTAKTRISVKDLQDLDG